MLEKEFLKKQDAILMHERLELLDNASRNKLPLKILEWILFKSQNVSDTGKKKNISDRGNWVKRQESIVPVRGIVSVMVLLG